MEGDDGETVGERVVEFARKQFAFGLAGEFGRERFVALCLAIGTGFDRSHPPGTTDEVPQPEAESESDGADADGHDVDGEDGVFRRCGERGIARPHR